MPDSRSSIPRPTAAAVRMGWCAIGTPSRCASLP